MRCWRLQAMATKLDPAANWEIKRHPVRVRQRIA